jgi:hypothetical protein
MITQASAEKIKGLDTNFALTQRKIVELLERKAIRSARR